MKKISYPIVVTIGIFDGVHKGHQVILKKALKEAKKLRLKSVVVTFDPHPVKVLYPGAKIPFLISLEHRIKLIKSMGIDNCVIIKFTKEFARLRPEEFIKDILIDKLNLKVLITGDNFLFGSEEKGGPRLLKKLSRIYNFKFYGIPPVKMGGKYISSTRIRKAIERGSLELAAKLLGRPVTVLGTVVKGKALGRKLGFPTANIDPHHESIPPAGVYSVDVALGKKLYRGILNISLHKIVEVHVLNFNGNIYGRDIEVIFKRKIRDEKKFKSLEALKKQIQLDILKAYY
ncbi:MAG: bifunctional riboflavin kinase/FAD synthetase [Candidatus Omnitrophota bacterium]|nr:bifunctional riboflavin kinase/FAD synthetase [Candidatus Omnitrophota bacterium]